MAIDYKKTAISSLISLNPFLCITITQPHSYLLCHPSSQKFEASCFDLQLNWSSADHVIERPFNSCTPMNDDFIYALLETKPGEPHPKTGIPPAFLTVTCSDIFSNQACVKISVERPMKLNFRTSMGKATITFLQRFQEKFTKIHPFMDYKFSSSSEKDVSVMMNVLTYLANIKFSTSQIIMEFTPLLDVNSEKLIISAGYLNLETDIETCKDNVKCLDLKLNMSSLIVQISSFDQTWNFLEPLSFSTLLKCHLKPCLQIELCILGESLLLNISLFHGLKMKMLIEAILKHFQKNFENIKNIFHSDIKFKDIDSNLVDSETKKRTYWNDDLRKGSFQFIQVVESDEYSPKPYEIVFNRFSANEPSSMTWCYPEPRTLTKIEVSPVPFQSGEENCDKVINCYLQYWNSTHQEYVNLCDFKLSETEQFNLDLPDLNSDSVAVSNKWRVLLDCGKCIDEDGIFEKENPYLSPLALAACMSIDSCFDPTLVPVFQVKASFELAKITFNNYFEKSGFSPKLFPFEFDDESPHIQVFSILTFINFSCSCSKRISKIKGELSSGVTCEILEYRNLTMLPIISPVDILANLTINLDRENVPIFDMEFILNPCFIRLSQSIFHTLTYTMQSISQVTQASALKNVCSEYMLPNYYIICNNLEERIRFGQTYARSRSPLVGEYASFPN
ncbi:vacuolar protein sorting-associated protein 13B [Caerostris darwini]|uniref:Vacuolar protein sorting-associated protein 13B n=1 Tax=Caerostris darwini TaxID=1538125 RepID=A0AAV4WQQ4_9ARAC|nr:vacuolar protein sorting-associated protein 13B [Caerostris darwini]